MPLYRQKSARLGAGATNVASGTDNAGTRQASTASSTSAADVGALTAGVGGTPRGGGGAIRRTARGLGRRAEDAARSFYVSGNRYTMRDPDAVANEKAEDYRVYSNDPGEASRGPTLLSQAPTATPAPAPAKPAAPVQDLVPVPKGPTLALQAPVQPQAPAQAPPPVLKVDSPTVVRQEAAAAAAGQTPPPTDPLAATRAEAASSNLSGRLPQAPAPVLLNTNPDVQGFLNAQRRGMFGR